MIETLLKKSVEIATTDGRFRGDLIEANDFWVKLWNYRHFSPKSTAVADGDKIMINRRFIFSIKEFAKPDFLREAGA